MGTDHAAHTARHANRRRFLTAASGALAGAALTACGGGEGDGPSGSGERARATPTAPAPEPDGPRPLYLGAYTSVAGGGDGIGVAAYESADGRIAAGRTVGDVPDPSYLAVHPDGRTLYAANEREEGAVTAVRLGDGEAPPRVLGTRPTGGSGTCHLSVHPSGRWLLSADYGSGSVAVHPLAADGAPGAATDRVVHGSPRPGPGQDGPHAHQILTAPGGHVLAVDLGTDTVYTYRLDTRAGTLAETARTTVRAGAGPRHLTFHPSGRYAYLANELDDTVQVCAYDARTGRLRPGRPQPTGSSGPATAYPANLAVTPDGRYAYLANRGPDVLTRYAVEAGGARLRLVDSVPAGGAFPRQIALSPSGRLLFAANQRSGTVSVHHVDPESGELRRAGRVFAAPGASCALPL